MTETEAALIALLTKSLKIQRTTPIVPETAIFGPRGGDSLGLDSVDVLEIAVLLDKHFGVSLEEGTEVVNGALASIGALAGYIDRHRGSAS